MIVRIQKDLILASAITWKYMQMIWTVKYRDRHFGGFYACCKNGSLKIGCYIYERIPKSYATSQEIYSFLPTDSPPSNESYFKGSVFNFSSKRKKKGLGLWCQRAYISEDFREAWLLQSPRICLSVYGVDLYHP